MSVERPSSGWACGCKRQHELIFAMPIPVATMEPGAASEALSTPPRRCGQTVSLSFGWKSGSLLKSSAFCLGGSTCAAYANFGVIGSVCASAQTTESAGNILFLSEGSSLQLECLF